MNHKNTDPWGFIIVSCGLFLLFIWAAYGASSAESQLADAEKEVAALKHSRAPITITITVKSASDVAPVMKAVLPALTDTEVLK